jgi:hypothetical protein
MLWHTAAACLIAGAVGAAGGFQLRSLIADRAELARVEADRESERAAQRARNLEQERTDAIAARYAARGHALARTAAADRAAADSLRDAINADAATASDAAACPDERRQRNVLAELVAEAAGLVAECAATGDRLAEQAGELRRHASEVSAVPVK